MAQNNYWMKLWFDILRDPKMGMLPDRLWRRVIELFLLAGQNGEDGLLPDVPTIAWQLNKPVTAIVADLNKIAEVGIVQEIQEGKWVVTNFKKRNEPVNPAKRTKDFRRRERYEKGNEDVTEVKRECNDALQLRYQEEQKNRGTDKQIKESINPSSSLTEKGDDDDDIYSGFESIAACTPQTKKAIDQAVETYGKAWVKDAIAEGVKRQAKSFAYVDKILASWKVNGKPQNGSKQPGADIEKFRELYRQQKRGKQC
jgi:hypothetical protein